MLAVGFATTGVTLWTTLVPVGAGAVVTSLVIGSAVVLGRWRRRLADDSQEEDLPWEVLLHLLEEHNQRRAAAGLPPEQATPEVVGELLAKLPSLPDARPLDLPEDREFLALGGDERRAGRRRWGNPTGVHLRSSLWYGELYGLVVNRSTGGLGIYADREVPPDTPLQVRAAEAPAGVPAVRLEVRHCRKVGKGFFVGCQFSDDIPWNVRVWFG
jgi:hypothetical protein